MRRKRLIWFLIMIAIGAAGGMAYGWYLNPVEYTNTDPTSLRADFKADYVLMVAEIYSSDQDLAAARERLALLGARSAQQMVSEGIVAAQQAGYAAGDLEAMSRLMQSLQAEPTPGGQP